MFTQVSNQVSRMWKRISTYKLVGSMQLLLGIGIVYRPNVGTLGILFGEIIPYYFAGMFLAGGFLLLFSKSNPLLLLVGTLPFSMYILLTFWGAFFQSPEIVPIQAPVIYTTMWILLQILVARENGGNGKHV